MEAREAELKKKKISAAYLGFCFNILFAAYAPSVNYTTTLAGASGELSLALVYGTLAVFSFLATSIIRFLGLRLSFILSSATYVGFIVSVLSRNDVFLYIASAVMGVGAAVLWVGQGIYIKTLAEDAPAGALTGLFFAIFSIYDLVGNGISSILLLMDNDVDVVLSVVTFVGVGAVVLFAFVPSRGLPAKSSASNNVSVQDKVRRTFAIMGDRRLLFMIPYMATQGVNMSFSLGSFFALIGAISENSISYISFCYGVVSMIFSWFWGKVADSRRGWAWIVSTHVILVFVTYGLTFYANEMDNLTVFYIAGAMFGMSNSSLQVLINTSIIQNFSSDSEQAFAAFRFINSCAFATGFLTGVFGGLTASVALACSLTAIGASFYTYLYVSVLPALALTQPRDQPRSSIDEGDSTTYGVDGSISLDGSQRKSSAAFSPHVPLPTSDSDRDHTNGHNGHATSATNDGDALLPKSTALSSD